VTSKMGQDVYRIRSPSALIKHSLPNVVGEEFFFSQKECAQPVYQ